MSNYTISFCPKFELPRVLQFVIIDDKINIFTKKVDGNDIQSFVDKEVAKANKDYILTYKVETELGNVVAYFCIDTKVVYMTHLTELRIRPQYLNDLASINKVINTFIANNEWKGDYL